MKKEGRWVFKSLLLIVFSFLLLINLVSAVDSVKMYNFGVEAFLCINCPEPKEVNGKMVFSCKDNAVKPCVFWTGFKFSEGYNANDKSDVAKVKYKLTTPKQYDNNLNLKSKTSYPFLLTPLDAPVTIGKLLTKDDVILDDNANDKALYKLNDKLRNFLFTDASVYFDKTSGKLLMVEGLSNADDNVPLEHLGLTKVPLKWGEYIKFKGLDDKGNYNLEKPVLFITTDPLQLTDKEERDMIIKYWWEGKGNYKGIEDYKSSTIKYQDKDGERPSKTLCGQTFVNYAPGSQFVLDLTKADRPCRLSEYKLSTVLIEEDDIKDNKGFFYNCGRMKYWAKGGEKQYDMSQGNIRKLYCDQSDPKKPKLYCLKDDNWCEQGNRFSFEIKDSNDVNHYLSIFYRMVSSKSKLPIDTFKKAEFGKGGELLVEAKKLWFGTDGIELPKGVFKIFSGNLVGVEVGDGAIIKRLKWGNYYIHRLKDDKYILELGISKNDKNGYVTAFYPKSYQGKLKADKKYISFATKYVDPSGLTFIHHFGAVPDKDLVAISWRDASPDVTFRPIKKGGKGVGIEAEQKYSDCHYFDAKKGESLKRLLAKECFSKDFTKLSVKQDYNTLNKINLLAYSVVKFNPNYFSKQKIPNIYKALARGTKGRDYTVEKDGKLCYRKTKTLLIIKGQRYFQLSPGLCPNLDLKEVIRKQKLNKTCPRGHYIYKVQVGDNFPKIAYKCGQLPLPSIHSSANKAKLERFLKAIEPANQGLIKNYRTWKKAYDKYGWAKTQAKGIPYYLTGYVPRAYNEPVKKPVVRPRTVLSSPRSSKFICIPNRIQCDPSKAWEAKRIVAKWKVAKKAKKQRRDVPPRITLSPRVDISKITKCTSLRDCRAGEGCSDLVGGKGYCLKKPVGGVCSKGFILDSTFKKVILCYPECSRDTDCDKFFQGGPYSCLVGKGDCEQKDRSDEPDLRNFEVQGKQVSTCNSASDCFSSENCILGICVEPCENGKCPKGYSCDNENGCFPSCKTKMDCKKLFNGAFPLCYSDGLCDIDGKADRHKSKPIVTGNKKEQTKRLISTVKKCDKSDDCKGVKGPTTKTSCSASGLCLEGPDGDNKCPNGYVLDANYCTPKCSEDANCVSLFGQDYRYCIVSTGKCSGFPPVGKKQDAPRPEIKKKICNAEVNCASDEICKITPNKNEGVCIKKEVAQPRVAVPRPKTLDKGVLYCSSDSDCKEWASANKVQYPLYAPFTDCWENICSGMCTQGVCPNGYLCNNDQFCWPKCSTNADCKKFYNGRFPICDVSTQNCKTEVVKKKDDVKSSIKSIKVGNIDIVKCKNDKGCASPSKCSYGICMTKCQKGQCSKGYYCNGADCEPECDSNATCIKIFGNEYPVCDNKACVEKTQPKPVTLPDKGRKIPVKRKTPTGSVVAEPKNMVSIHYGNTLVIFDPMKALWRTTLTRGVSTLTDMGNSFKTGMFHIAKFLQKECTGNWEDSDCKVEVLCGNFNKNIVGTDFLSAENGAPVTQSKMFRVVHNIVIKNCLAKTQKKLSFDYPKLDFTIYQGRWAMDNSWDYQVNKGLWKNPGFSRLTKSKNLDFEMGLNIIAVNTRDKCADGYWGKYCYLDIKGCIGGKTRINANEIYQHSSRHDVLRSYMAKKIADCQTLAN